MMESPGRWGLDSLIRIGVPGEPDMRPTLLRVLTELYVQKPAHTADEERHYTELALRLLDAADLSTRTAVARRLAHYTSPPRRVLARLAADNSLANGQRQPRWPILNDRLPAAVTVEIATTLNDLFFAATPSERRLILLNLDVIAPFPAGRMNLSHEESLSRRLEAAVLSRNREAFAQHLAQTLHIPRTQARRVADDDLGESIVTAAKALNIRRGALYRILLFLDAGRSMARVQALTELHHELPMQTAEHMVAIWQSLPKLAPPVECHQPLLWNDTSAANGRMVVSAIAHQADMSPSEKRDAS
jgi:hypothetical protein